MKKHLIKKYKELVKSGEFQAAKWLLNILIRKPQSVLIGDGNDEVYDSGLANYFMEGGYNWNLSNSGFRVYFKF